MEEYVCWRCHQSLPETEFWNIHKPDKKISDNTKAIVNRRGNKQRYCKQCCNDWYEDNSMRKKDYDRRYRTKMREKRQQSKEINTM